MLRRGEHRVPGYPPTCCHRCRRRRRNFEEHIPDPSSRAWTFVMGGAAAEENVERRKAVAREYVMDMLPGLPQVSVIPCVTSRMVSGVDPSVFGLQLTHARVSPRMVSGVDPSVFGLQLTHAHLYLAGGSRVVRCRAADGGGDE